MSYLKYNVTPASNNNPPPNGAPEGMAPSGVNDTTRDMMSVIRMLGDRGNAALTVSMTAGNVTLTDTQSRNVSYNFTGTPATNVAATWPASTIGLFYVRSSLTDGSFLTVGMATGATVTMFPGQFAVVMADGTDFFTTGIVATSAPSGTSAGSIIHHSIATTADTMAINPGVGADLFRSYYQFGGSTMRGVRQAIDGIAELTAPTSTSNQSRFYVAGSFTAQMNTDDTGVATTLTADAVGGAGGLTVASIAGAADGDNILIQLDTPYKGAPYWGTAISGAPFGSTINLATVMPSQASSGNIVMVVRGASQGAIAQSVLQAAAKNFSAAEGFEANISIQTGATVGDKIQLDVANNPDDAVQGARYDIMAGLSGGLGAVLTRTGFGIGDWAGQFPIATDGWIMRAFAQFGATVGGGIDFTNIEIDGPLIQGTSNTTTLPSINAVPGISLSGNHSGGSGEINLFNTFAAAGTTFIVQQMTGAGTKVDVLQVDPSPAAGNTAMVLLLNNGGLSSQRISFGIADSAGAGFRVLRIPN